ncbi:CRAL-TRIO domain-containing protein [Chaetomium fimeti]|uniref:CRAL-TRIO domain-containing protein n=1 Tax=Chaetomium fimeti TaxID=1854472 RepID=A0AAE0HCS4_9PEZI|nr:CRAL-TRIO domain-containing protein [Chaetomium fimeti]
MADAPAEKTTSAGQDVGYPHGHLGHLTEGEENQLKAFKVFLEEKDLYKAGPPPSHDDQTLLRFLRARKWVVNDAYQQFKDTEAWRQANHLNVLYDTIDVDAYEQTRRLYPQWTGRRDRRGIPLYLFQIRHLDSKTVSAYEKASESANVSKAETDGSTPQRLLRLFALYENLTRFAQPLCTELTDREHAGTPITLSTNIVDVSQVSLRMFWNLKAHMQAASTLATAHYPETLDRIFIIGAPYFFSTVWGWIKRWFDPITVSKIFILSAAEVRPTLEAFIEPRNIPKQYGGELEFEFFDRPNVDPNIKDAVRWEGGHTDFPAGPLYWVPVDDGARLACMAVGSKDGKERRERVGTIPVTFPKGEMAAQPVADAAVAAAVAPVAEASTAPAEAAVEGIQKLSITDNNVAGEIEEKVAAGAGGQQPDQKATAVPS